MDTKRSMCSSDWATTRSTSANTCRRNGENLLYALIVLSEILPFTMIIGIFRFRAFQMRLGQISVSTMMRALNVESAIKRFTV
ncbi:MAG: hypothetical protein A4E58_01465 [Syntrophorhabdus sp. PtaB.Bin006]|nr:MAG: hypothetical protein A4E58_01465 [Syntrophorhabdus sp. PtaB.Bin006]